jgi:hypothetical protein
MHDGKTQYEPPRLCVVGLVSRLTGDQDKKLGQTDGLTFLGDPITNNS